jgi:putative membrane protein
MLFLKYVIAIFAGITAGIVTGLTPGIHINLISVLLIAITPTLAKYADFTSLSCFIIAMSVTHSFLDSIPSIFLGAPEEATALGVLPGHRYLLRGNGLMAVKLTIIGSLGALLLSILLFPILIPIVSFIYPLIKNYIGYILIVVVIFMIQRDKKRLWAMFVFFLAGTFGIIVFNIPTLKNPLFPMLSGLFGVATLLISLKDTNNIPKQNEMQVVKLRWPLLAKSLLSGQFSGWLTSMFPGLGASTAAILSLQITKKLGDHGFMVLMGSINTVNFILSMVTLYSLNKARNGSIIAIQKTASFFQTELTIPLIIIFLIATLISGTIAAVLALKIGRLFSRHITKINYQFLLSSIIAFIILLTILLTGPIGLFVLLISTAIGFISPIVKVTRTHAMGCLLLPVIMYFIL